MNSHHTPLAALCCHSNALFLAREGNDHLITAPLEQSQKLAACIKKDEIVLVRGIEQQFDGLAQPLNLAIIDLEVELRRLNNGTDHLQQPSVKSFKRPFNHEVSNLTSLKKMIEQGRHLLEKVDCLQALQRAQTVLDHREVYRQGLPLNPSKLKAFQLNRKHQFDQLCREQGLDHIFRYGQLSSRNLKAYIAANYAGSWPKNAQGDFRIDKDTLSDMAKTLGGEAKKIYQLFKLSRWLSVRITTDERGHHLIKQEPYGTKTGRCRAVGSSILGLPKPMRQALLACEDRYLVEVDVSSQDIAVAAGLSGDLQMIETYESRDFYLATAEFAGESINKANEPKLRSKYKLIALAVFYGMTPSTLACKLGCSVHHAAALIASYKACFRGFEDWINEVIFYAYLNNQISTVSGWQMYVDDSTKERTLMNWPIQAAGADLMNLALRKALLRGLPVGAINHDALYISTDTKAEVNDAAEQLTQCIQEAAEEIIPAIKIKTSTTVLGPEQALLSPSNIRELFWNF